MPRNHLSLLLLSTLLAAAQAPSVAHAGKGPSSDQVDDGLSTLDAEQRTELSGATATHSQALQDFTSAEHDLEIARLEEKATKAWQGSAQARLGALQAELEAATRSEDRERAESLSAELVRADGALVWSEARAAAAKKRGLYETARVVWAKANVDRSVIEVEVARLKTYKAHVQDSPEVDISIGKAQTRLGKARTAEGRERGKRDKAQEQWDEAVGMAAGLEPARDAQTLPSRSAASAD